MKILKSRCIIISLLVCLSLSSCNIGEFQPSVPSESKSEVSSERPLDETIQERTSTSEISTNEEPSMSASEAQEKRSNAYSTILVAYENGTLQAKFIEELKNSKEPDSERMYPTNSPESKTYGCRNILGDIIFFTYNDNNHMGGFMATYNIHTQEMIAVLESHGFVFLQNQKVAGILKESGSMEGDISTFDIASFDEKSGIDLSIGML